jgi:predicted nucleic acid-binding protein
MSVFVDSWAWLGSFDRRDPYHEQAKACILSSIERKVPLVTTDHVLSETITTLFRRAKKGTESQVIKDLLEFLDVWEVAVEPITPNRFAKALDLRFRYEDTPEISFTDLTSMVVMQELGIREILTADRILKR